MIGMFPNKIRLCELFGIPLYLDFSLIILMIFFVTGGGSFASGISCALMLLVSITAHEFGHALTARAFGYETRDITLSLLGGCASLIALPRKANEELLTALAGPAVSLLLSFLGMLGIALVASHGTIGDAALFVLAETLGSFGIPVSFDIPIYCTPANMHLLSLLAYFAVMNAMLMAFNLLPGFPLDGGRVFRSLMRNFMPRAKATYIAMMVGRVVAVLIALKGVYAILHGGNWGFVTCLIAWMIWREGHREYRLALMEANWDYQDFRAHVSPPPYGGDDDDCDVTKDR